MWYLIISKRKVAMAAVKAVTSDHFVWMKAQHATGTVLISGPTPDRTMGIYVVRADSAENAHAIVKTDPFHAQDLRTYDLIPWEVHQMLGVGPFSLDGIQHLATNDPSDHYTLLPKD